MTKGAQKTEKIRTANQPTRESHASVPRNRLPPIDKSHLLKIQVKLSNFKIFHSQKYQINEILCLEG